MKNFARIAVIASSLTLAALPALRAADEPAPQPPPSSGAPDAGARPERTGRRGRWMDPAERLRHMTEVLGLTDGQQAQMKAIFKDEMEKRRAIMEDESLAPEDRRAKMMALGQDMRTRLRALLTPEQQQKFDAMPRPGRGPRGEVPSGDAPPPPPANHPPPAGNPI